jgi:LPXTG-motif cell wall-anchored protein
MLVWRTSVAFAAVVALALVAGGAQADEGRVVGVRAVAVAPTPQPQTQTGDPASPAEGARRAGAAASGGASGAVPADAPAAAVDATTVTARPLARAAASGGVTISDFAFHPGATTVHVGDTISWTNEDAASHTATADDGSFDTGALGRGASGAHTFASAGTFAYHCSIHPSMRGTVTVLASSASSGTSSPTSSPAAAPAAATLPNTGANALGLALVGFGLLLAGLLLRTRTRPR